MERIANHWQAHPTDHPTDHPHEHLHEHVVWPVRFEVHHDDSIPASKHRGYDALGLLCWCRHHFAQWDASVDDDDQPTMQLLSEERALLAPAVGVTEANALAYAQAGADLLVSSAPYFAAAADVKVVIAAVRPG